MDISFDIRGNLKPYDKVQLTEDNFREIFVDSFGRESIRYKIYQNYNNYIQDFREFVSEDFIQWID